jgi:hypothetical protein
LVSLSPAQAQPLGQAELAIISAYFLFLINSRNKWLRLTIAPGLAKCFSLFLFLSTLYYFSPRKPDKNVKTEAEETCVSKYQNRRNALNGA